MFEYNLVRRKSLEEILDCYNSFRSGNLKLNGNQYEINQMYIQKIEELITYFENEQIKSSYL